MAKGYLPWQGREAEYTYRFTEADVAELAAAVDRVKFSGVRSETDILQVIMHSYELVSAQKGAACFVFFFFSVLNYLINAMYTLAAAVLAQKLFML